MDGINSLQNTTTYIIDYMFFKTNIKFNTRNIQLEKSKYCIKCLHKQLCIHQ
jgi:hypothetical protein